MSAQPAEDDAGPPADDELLKPSEIQLELPTPIQPPESPAGLETALQAALAPIMEAQSELKARLTETSEAVAAIASRLELQSHEQRYGPTRANAGTVRVSDLLGDHAEFNHTHLRAAFAGAAAKTIAANRWSLASVTTAAAAKGSPPRGAEETKSTPVRCTSSGGFARSGSIGSAVLAAVRKASPSPRPQKADDDQPRRGRGNEEWQRRLSKSSPPAAQSVKLARGSCCSPAQEEPSLEHTEQHVDAALGDADLHHLIQRMHHEHDAALRMAQDVRWRCERQVHKLVISETSPLRLSWDAFLGLILAYLLTVLPVQLAFFAFLSRDFMDVSLRILDAVLFADIPVNFLSAYSRNDEVVSEPRLIARRYISGWFWFDMVAVIPAFLPLSHRAACHGGWAPIRVAQMLRLLKLLRLPDLLQRRRKAHNLARDISLESRFSWLVEALLLENSHPGARLVGLVLSLLVVWHTVGCAYWLLEAAVFEGCAEWVATDGDGNEGRFPPEVASSGWQAYSWAYYWAVSVSMAFNLPHVPAHVPSQWLIVFVVALGTFTTSIVIGWAASLLSHLNHAEHVHTERMGTVTEMLARHSVDPKLKRKVLTYFEYAWRAHGDSIDEAKLVADLPFTLRLQLTLLSHRKLFRGVPLFRNTDTRIICMLIQHMRPLIALPGEVVLREGTEGAGLFMIEKGMVEVVKLGSSGAKSSDTISPSLTRALSSMSDAASWLVKASRRPSAESLTTLQRGDFFGETSLLTGTSVKASVRSVGYSSLLVLLATTFASFLERFPTLRAELEKEHREKERKVDSIRQSTRCSCTGRAPGKSAIGPLTPP